MRGNGRHVLFGAPREAVVLAERCKSRRVLPVVKQVASEVAGDGARVSLGNNRY